MNRGDRAYLEALLQVLPWCVGNVTPDVQPFKNGVMPTANQCSQNAADRVRDDPALRLDYGWLVGRKLLRFICVGHVLNTGLDRDNITNRGVYFDPTPMAAGFEPIAFVPDPLTFQIWNDRKGRLDELPDDELHFFLEEILSRKLA